MAEVTGTELTNANTGILSKIYGIFSNVKKLKSDPAVQKTVPLAFGIIVTFVGIIAFIGYNSLIASMDRVIFKMEAATVEFMDLLQEPS